MEQSSDLNEVLAFVRVAQLGSFTAAAKALGMPKSTVSRKISELEARLGTRLLQRTTRKLSLTDTGRLYFQHGERVVLELEAAEAAVNQLQQAPRGLLRVTTPLNFSYLAPVVSSFLRRYPEVQVDLVGTDRMVDLVEEGFDVAIRAGRLSDSTLVARQLGSLGRYVMASPAYLKKHGVPETPADLAKHAVLYFSGGRDRNRWQLEANGEVTEVVVQSRLLVNDFDLLTQAAEQGLGIAMLPVDRCVDAIRRKTLRRVLPNWSSPAAPIHAVYPSARHLSPKVRAFLDHLRENMTPPPWELGPKM